MERGSRPSSVAVVSICISALTTGLVSKNISWNYDTNPVKRKNTPDFYGYIPKDHVERSVMAVCMVINSTALLLLRSFSAAMLMLVETRYERPPRSRSFTHARASDSPYQTRSSKHADRQTPIKTRCSAVHTDLKVLGQRCVCVWRRSKYAAPLFTPT